MVGAVAHGVGVALGVVAVADHQPDRAPAGPGQPQAQLALGSGARALRAGRGVQQHHVVAGHGRPIEPGTTSWPGELPTCSGGLGLAEAVADGQAPGPSRTCSITSGFSGSPAPTISRSGQPVAPRAQVLLDEHPPDRRRRAERGRPGRGHRLQQPGRVEAGLVDHEDRRLGVPRREEELHACLAQPGEEMLRCTSPGRRPIQYIVDRWPTG